MAEPDRIGQYATPGLRFCKIRRGTKRPFELDWVNKPYSWGEIMPHVRSEGNFGVLCGYGDLIVVDCDEVELVEAVHAGLPETFEVRTGSGGRHCYYICPEVQKKIVLQTAQKHYGEVQARGAQVVGAGSLHPNGSRYVVEQDRPIARVSLEQLTACIRPFIREVEVAHEHARAELRDFGEDDINSISILSVIDARGFRRSHDGELYGANPWHGSSTGMNFWINTAKNVAYCFRCNAGVSVAKAIALQHGVCKMCADSLRGEKFNEVRRIAEAKYGLPRKVIVRGRH